VWREREQRLSNVYGLDKKPTTEKEREKREKKKERE
jgi:hypothetical protein